MTSKKDGAVDAEKTEVQEWFRRSEGFEKLCQNVTELAKKLSRCANKELCYDLFTYVWDITGVLSLLSAYIKWLALGNFPANLNMYTQGSYTCEYLYSIDHLFLVLGVQKQNFIKKFILNFTGPSRWVSKNSNIASIEYL